MAEHDVKSDVSIFKTLRLSKIGYTSIRHESRRTGITTRYSRCPSLNLKGNWLEDTRFATNTPVSVTADNTAVS
ncbi:SymE family type I addiction module toxin [Pluralibacter gergoviae]|uniref:SymE family type I addiction module toxin n=1 Tax=Pluralibacter gergoviae TaxID=61647 RepID=UPI000B2BC70A|nr:SymE family type I addiction module toxin [Pluralibacter gergoviae]